MQITPIKNQYNRTNFNGWKTLKEGDAPVFTVRAIDSAILDLVSGIQPEQIYLKPQNPSFFFPVNITLKDGTKIEYLNRNGLLRIVDTKSKGLLASLGFYSWHSDTRDAEMQRVQKQFTEATDRLAQLLREDN